MLQVWPLCLPENVIKVHFFVCLFYVLILKRGKGEELVIFSHLPVHWGSNLDRQVLVIRQQVYLSCWPPFGNF